MALGQPIDLMMWSLFDDSMLMIWRCVTEKQSANHHRLIIVFGYVVGIVVFTNMPSCGLKREDVQHDD